MYRFALVFRQQSRTRQWVWVSTKIQHWVHTVHAWGAQPALELSRHGQIFGCTSAQPFAEVSAPYQRWGQQHVFSWYVRLSSVIPDSFPALLTGPPSPPAHSFLPSTTFFPLQPFPLAQKSTRQRAKLLRTPRAGLSPEVSFAYSTISPSPLLSGGRSLYVEALVNESIPAPFCPPLALPDPPFHT